MSIKLQVSVTNKNNTIDKELQSVLRPLSLIETLLISSKYKIQNDKITTHNKCYNVVSFIALLFKLILIVYTARQAFLQYGKTDLLGFGIMYETMYNFIGWCLNYYNNIIHGPSTIVLILKIQNIQRNLKIDGKKYIRSNWCWFIFMSCFYITYNIIYYIVYRIKDVSLCLTLFLFISFDFNVIYAMIILKILCECVKVWTKDLRRAEHLRGSEYEFYWKNMFKVFMEIFEAYQLLQKTVQKMVSITIWYWRIMMMLRLTRALCFL